MHSTARGILDGLIVAVAGATAGYGVTFVIKHHAPAFFLLWIPSGAIIAFLLARWKPRQWLIAGLATPALVLAETVARSPKAGPTAAALSLAFGLGWAGLTFVGALAVRLGRTGYSRALNRS
ncbi:MAG TPA: hypothetical protein VFX87_11145 [Methylomirabilota bacterium]|nr:hypothetical protein [Methylomirabilota bacterium]